jgi:hypothetical protein
MNFNYILCDAVLQHCLLPYAILFLPNQSVQHHVSCDIILGDYGILPWFCCGIYLAVKVVDALAIGLGRISFEMNDLVIHVFLRLYFNDVNRSVGFYYKIGLIFLPLPYVIESGGSFRAKILCVPILF